MLEEIVSLDNETKKQSKQSKKTKTIPSINRVDIMSGILSEDLDNAERLKLSNLYAEITYMEKKDMKYINKITVSSQSDLEIYEIIKKLNNKKNKLKNELLFSTSKDTN